MAAAQRALTGVRGLGPVGVAQVRRDAAVLALELLSLSGAMDESSKGKAGGQPKRKQLQLGMDADAIEHPDATNDDFNLSTDESTTVLELAQTIWAKMRGAEEPFRYVSDPPFEHDVQRRVPSTEKAKRVLGFEATTSLSTMLDEVIPWVTNAVAEGRI